MSSSDSSNSKTKEHASGLPPSENVPSRKFWTNAPSIKAARKFIGENKSLVYIPPTESLAVWNSPPNKEQHASFGDGGTTASATCNGDLIQMTRFLGLGSSGLFTIDQGTTDEPYQVYGRAWDLENKHDYLRPFIILPPIDSLGGSSVPPEVKWVNWKWPRYEYPRTDEGLRITIQYMVHEGIVLQQVIVQNLSDVSVELELPYKLQPELFIRDLDFMNPDYEFNNPFKSTEKDSKDYWYLPGPGGYGHVLVNQLEMPQRNDDTPVAVTSTKTGSNFDIQNAEDADAQTTPSPATKTDATHAKSDARKTSIEQQERQKFSEQPPGIASLITMFVNGRAVRKRGATAKGGQAEKWKMPSEEDTDSTASVKKTLKTQGQLEIIVAYKLMETSQTEGDWRKFVISAKDANINEYLRDEVEKFWKTVPISALRLSQVDQENTNPAQPTAVQDTGKQRDLETQGRQREALSGELRLGSARPEMFLEYLAWRHLEHILSVCAVPMCVSDPEGNTPLQLVALTCGDMAGHRVCTSASFFAFLFLVDMARRLKSQPGVSAHPYVVDLRKRIHQVCRDHVRWLEWLRKSNKLLPTGCFAANYWVTGNKIPRSSSTWLPDDTITDTAFQILKMTEYYVEDRELWNEATTWMDEILNETYAHWLIELDKIDTRKFFAWRRTKVDGFNKFRLSDHFWIWKSLHSLQQCDSATSKGGVKDSAESHSNGDSVLQKLCDLTQKDEEHCKWMRERLRSSKARRQILQRFTTENEALGRRMLALTRTPAESRFMFHARDTALFWGEQFGLFSSDGGNSHQQLWQRTIETQSLHEEMLDTDWDKSMRYALGIAIGSREYRLGSLKPNSLIVTCTETLINCCGHNGFFPGLLDAKKPVMFSQESERDFYFHAGFEIHCVLLQNMAKITTSFQADSRSTDAKEQQDAGSSITRDRTIESRLDALGLVLSRLAGENMADSASRPTDGTKAQMNPRNIPLKKSIPSNGPVDSTNITLVDDEWLYNYPEFFLNKSNLRDYSELHGYVLQYLESSEASQGTATLGTVIGSAMQKLPSQLPPVLATVWDAPKQKNRGKRTNLTKDSELFNNGEGLVGYLAAHRTADEAKKRFIWLPDSRPHSALICWACTPDLTEQLSLSHFFDCHAQYGKLVLDDTNKLLNTWKTELHLSFYVLSWLQELESDTIPGLDKETLPGEPDRFLVRASMSFRFDGDFSDRFWTCSVVDHVPSRYEPEPLLEPWDLPKSNVATVSAYKPKWQRKVLEVLLVRRILRPIAKMATDVLLFAQERLDLKKDDPSFRGIETVTKLRSTHGWPEIERLLEWTADDLTSTLEKLKEWDNREKDRGKEQPRWTRNDEKKYRQTITKLQAAYKSQIRQISSTRDQLRKLKEKLSSQRERLEKRLEFHGNENIRYFTYVTIIFLPLGFATSFYSMNGPPDYTIMIALVEFAVAAFVVTAILILSFRPMAEAADAITSSNGYRKFLRVISWPARLKLLNFRDSYCWIKARVRSTASGTLPFFTTHKPGHDTSELEPTTNRSFSRHLNLGASSRLWQLAVDTMLKKDPEQ